MAKKYGLKTLFYTLHECSECGETDASKFRKRRYKCKKCCNIESATRFRDRKQKFANYKGGKCEICGYDKCLGSLDFHHRDPKEKDPDWRKMKNMDLESVRDELDKCMLLCRNCHGEIHYFELYKRG